MQSEKLFLTKRQDYRRTGDGEKREQEKKRLEN
jgi:hypothetical protein